MNFLINLICFALIAAWCYYSYTLITKLKNSGDLNSVNPYIFDSIPSIFTTLGIFGTFTGIFFGLLAFDVKNIDKSIPQLLEGLKTAFSTSIVGILCSIGFGKWSKFVLHEVELKSSAQTPDELAALRAVIAEIQNLQSQSNTHFASLRNALIGESDDSVVTHLTKFRNQFSDFAIQSNTQTEYLKTISASIGGDSETSLLTQIQKLRADQNDLKSSVVNGLKDFFSDISSKLDAFNEILKKNNTEALVDVMKKATEEFNKQMKELIDKLVQENFKELNTSVQRLNDWQKENKEMIQSLTDQFKKVSQEFLITSEQITKITENTSKLTDENSILTALIAELRQVLIEDQKFKSIIDTLESTINEVKANTTAFSETTNKLNDWVRNQMNFSDSVAKLLLRLEEIDKIKDINEVFWSNTKKQLEEGVSIITKASHSLRNDLDSVNAEFYERLNATLQNLDTLIQRIIEKHNG